ncbi:hypothetical protein IJI91_01510 [Candidatus Saccharibacteria bacterium]|nr:hypothetical protein [Candidatus Saccharibacteria bacterium]MBR0460650.1 hypothetical protein [Candidatus Saccharibacteria bacterium]
MSERTVIMDRFLLGLEIKKFLAGLFGYDNDNNEKSYSKERIAAFWDIIQRVLEPEEEQIIYNLLHRIKTEEELSEREKFFYKLAVAKLKGDVLVVNQLRTSKEADEYLPPAPSRITHVQEELKYRNAKRSLEQIQRSKDDPWLIGKIWL